MAFRITAVQMVVVAFYLVAVAAGCSSNKPLKTITRKGGLKTGEERSSDQKEKTPNGYVLRYLGVIKTTFDVDGETVKYTDEEIENIERIFTKLFPSYMEEITDGRVILENEVVVSDSPIKKWNSNLEFIGPTDVDDWKKQANGFDIVYLFSPRRQKAIYALGSGFTETENNGKVGWISIGSITGKPKSLLERPLPGFAHESLHILGEAYFRNTRNLDKIPGVHDGEARGYSVDTDGMNYWNAWYRDYFNGEILKDGEKWGLGERAWKLGPPREYFSPENNLTAK